MGDNRLKTRVAKKILNYCINKHNILELITAFNLHYMETLLVLGQT